MINVVAHLLIALAVSLLVQSRDGVLPTQHPPRWIAADLSRRYSNWRLAIPDLQQLGYYDGEQSTRTRTQVLIHGDFNGDRCRDYALLIWVGSETPMRRLVAYLASGRSFKFYDLGTLDIADQCWLELASAGETLYDNSQAHEIRCRHQTILIPCLEKTGLAFEYRRGTFRRFVWNQWSD